MSKEALIQAMGSLVSSHGYQNVTLEMLSRAAGCPIGSFQHVMGQTYTEFKQQYITSENSAHVITRRRLDADTRRNSILQVSADFVEKTDGGMLKLNMVTLAEETKLSHSTIQYYFHNTEELREAVIAYAIANNRVQIINQAAALYPSRNLISDNNDLTNQ
jgi:AcrR family transcriptional regulator